VNDLDAASNLLEEVVQIDSAAPLPRLEWSEVLLDQGDRDRARSVLEPIETDIRFHADRDPYLAARYFELRGRALSGSGDLAVMAALFEEAARHAPRDIRLRGRLIGLYRAQRDRSGVLRHLEAATKILPYNADLHVEVGHELLALSRWKEAEEAFRRALSLEWESAQAWDGLGISLTGQRLFSDAEKAFRDGLEIAPLSAILHEHLGDVLFAGGRPKEALTEYERAAVLAGGERKELSSKIDRAAATSKP
jgi:tetratricopeptide (TPR) repeat protein